MINKDLNYIAKLEKAISEKFGEKATLNPKAFWNEEKEKQFVEENKVVLKKEVLSEQTKEKIEIEGILINKKILKNSFDKNCCVCKSYSFNKKDDLFLLKYKTCNKCYIQYIEDREDRWLSGWRPMEN
jgi:hypothetical protein